PHARALYAIVRDLMNTRDGATYMAGRVWGISTHYNLGGDHPLVGHSVPNFEFENGTSIGELMRDGQGILLDFDTNVSLKTLASEYNDSIKYISGRAKDQLSIRAALIRPDGIIAWASDNNPDYSELHKAVTRWFVCHSEIGR
ncbi:MAG TPA: FAD-dependent oxidoreductase, partial [Cyclobacteriaceae bacterium]